MDSESVYLYLYNKYKIGKTLNLEDTYLLGEMKTKLKLKQN
jgi:hypothetical protein